MMGNVAHQWSGTVEAEKGTIWLFMAHTTPFRMIATMRF